MTTKAITDSPPQGGMKQFLATWTPRAIAAAIGGYYGLGIAYDCGLLAAIDRVAIEVIKRYVGYVGVGALMPTIQWYTALGARVTIGFAAGLLYALVERALLSMGRRCSALCKWY